MSDNADNLNVDDLIKGSRLERYLEEGYDAPFVAAAFVQRVASVFDQATGKRAKSGPGMIEVYNIFKPGNYTDGNLNARIRVLAEKMWSDGICDVRDMKESEEWDEKIAEVVPLWEAARLGGIALNERKLLKALRADAKGTGIEGLLNDLDPYLASSDVEEPGTKARRLENVERELRDMEEKHQEKKRRLEAERLSLQMQSPTLVEENRDVQQQTPTTATAYRSLSGGGTGVAYRCLSGEAILQPVPPTPSILALVVLKRHLEKERAAATAAA